MNKAPKVLVLDIETLPMEVFVWQLKDQYVQTNQIKHDWSVGAWGAKWVGDDTFLYADTRGQKNLRDDSKILKPLWKLIDEADYIITQNGEKFDWPKLKARYMLLGYQPPSSFKHIDLFKKFKGFGFTSHSLEYLTNKFCKKYKKISHKAFPGLSLWIQCLAENKKAWDAMEEYNKHDVFSTEELYFVTKEWDPKTQWELKNPKLACKRCGGKTFNSNGVRGGSQRVICKGCGLGATEEN